MKAKLLFTLAFALVTTLLTANQPGAIDPTFKSGGGVSGVVEVIVRQKDGKILIGGGFSSVQQVPRNGIARLLSNGSVDLSFNPGAGFQDPVYDMAVQPDGKILVCGSFNRYNGLYTNSLIRLNADGSRDTSFVTGNDTDGSIYKLALLPDGKIVIGGSFSAYNGIARGRLARLNANGSLDTSFNTAVGASSTIYSLKALTNGQVVIGGLFSTYDGVARQRLARINSDGSLDASFNSAAGANNTVYAIAIQPDGKVIIGGFFTSYAGTTRNRLARVNTDGTLDLSFDPGDAANDTVNSLLLLADGTLIIGGEFTAYNNGVKLRVARVNADGSRFANFSGNVESSGDYGNVKALALQPDGKILIGGEFSDYRAVGRKNLARLTNVGALDLTFNPSSGANSTVRAIARQPDGKIFIGGDFSSYDAIFRRRLARLKADGSLDPSFDSGLGANDVIHAMQLQPDGKLIIAGAFTSYGGLTRQRIARVNPDGSVDTSFNSSFGASDTIYAIALQADGKIVIGGDFITYGGGVRTYLARVNADGSHDATFNPGVTSPNGRVNALAIQADGKVVLGGEFTALGGTSRKRIARVNADGTLDAGFNPGEGFNDHVFAVLIQPDQKVLVGGGFNIFNAIVPRAMLARLNSDGTLDASLDSGPLFGDQYSIYTLLMQPGGKILIGGDFGSYRATHVANLARIQPDGKIDMGFNPGAFEIGNEVRALVQQPDGKVLIGGRINSYDSRSVSHITRVLTDYAFAATTFTGITIQEGTDGAYTDTPLVGSFTLSLAKGGIYSGALNLGSRLDSKAKGSTEKIALVGAFDKDGTSRISVARNDGRQLHLDLSLERTATGAAYVEGTLQDLEGHSVLLKANAPFFTSGQLPATHYVGRYHTALTPAMGIGPGAVPPAGGGYLAGVASADGKINFTGKAGDGSTLTASVNLGSDGEVLLHFPLYAGKGGLTGRFFVDDRKFNPENPAPVFSDLLVWRSPPSTFYPAGFTHQVLETTFAYVPKAAALPPFGGVALDSVEARIYGGNFSAIGLKSRLSFTTAGLGVLLGGPALPGTVIESLKIKLDRKTGLFTGTFIPPGSNKPVPIQGLILSDILAIGYSLVPSGGVTLPSAVTLQVLVP